VLNKTVQYVTVVPHKAATGVLRAVYDQARAEMGMLPEAVTMFSPAPEVGLAAWGTFRESLLSTGHASRALKEAVAARVSTLNQCPYCVDAHTILLYGSGANDFATSVLSGIQPPAGELAEISDWVTSVMTRPAAPLPAPFPPEQIPEIVGTLVEFQFLNRVINVLLNGTFLPGPDQAKRVARKVTGRIFARRIKAHREPGGAVGLVAGLPIPADLNWAAPSPAIASAYAALAAACTEAAARVVPPSVVTLVERTLDGWDGQFPGPSRAWLTGLVASLPLADQAVGRLALLTAMAPFQVVADDVASFRADHHEDADLVALLTWAAFTAARRIGAWSVPAPQPA
jgi:AhpD family alkylhydroperoxidase